MLNNHKIDISREHIIQPFGSGIKLLRPDTQVPLHSSHTLSDLITVPFNFFILSPQAIVEFANEEQVKSLNFCSEKALIGKSLYTLFQKEFHEPIIRNNDLVLKTRAMTFFDESGPILPVGIKEYLAIKLPLVNDQNKVLGLLGFSINITQQSIADYLNMLQRFGFINADHSSLFPFNTKVFNFSKREEDCARCFMQGQITAKQIAAKLNLQPRTVEFYIENMKIKAHAQSKIDLIQKIHEQSRLIVRPRL